MQTLSAVAKAWAPAMGAAVAGFFAAGAPVLGGLYPLGISLAAGLPGVWGLGAAAGAGIGCLVWDVPQAPAYLAGLGAAALALAPGVLGRRGLWPLAGAAAGSVCLCAVRCAMQLADGAGVAGLVAAAAEALMVLGMSYLLAGWLAVPGGLHKGFVWADVPQQAGAVLAGMMALATLAPWQVLSLHPACVLGAALVLAAAWRRGASGACLAGCAAACALCAARPEDAFAAVGLISGGLAAGLFFGEGRALTAGVFCGAGALGALCAGDPGPGLLLMVEWLAGGCVFCALPRRILERLPAPGAVGMPASDGTLAPHLRALGAALDTVGRTVGAVCEACARPPKASRSLADAVSEDCCRSCRQRTRCWVEEANDTYEAFAQLTGQVAQGQWAQAETLPDALKRRCVQPVTLAGAVNAAAARQAMERETWARAKHTRVALCEQYTALAQALTGLAAQAKDRVHAEPLLARRVRQMMREAGFEPLDAAAGTDGRGRLTVWVSLAPIDFAEAELDALTTEAGRVCHRALSRCHVHTGQVTTLCWHQAPRYAAHFGVCSLPAKGDISADAVRTRAGQWLCAVLCDGMGTGKAAAVDGALAAKLSEELLSAGFAPAQTARLVNVAMSLKGGSEAATTLDLLRVDPFTGQAGLYKAGAAPSFVLRADGRVETLKTDSVPVGILDEVIGRGGTVQLEPGDAVVLVSDGAMVRGAGALAAHLASHRGLPPDSLARSTARAARAVSPRPDDITVAVLRLEPADPRAADAGASS